MVTSTTLRTSPYISLELPVDLNEKQVWEVVNESFLSAAFGLVPPLTNLFMSNTGPFIAPQPNQLDGEVENWTCYLVGFNWDIAEVIESGNVMAGEKNILSFRATPEFAKICQKILVVLGQLLKTHVVCINTKQGVRFTAGDYEEFEDVWGSLSVLPQSPATTLSVSHSIPVDEYRHCSYIVDSEGEFRLTDEMVSPGCFIRDRRPQVHTIYTRMMYFFSSGESVFGVYFPGPNSI